MNLPESVSDCGTLLLQHMELGDSLICNAITRHVVQARPKPVGLFVRRTFLPSTRFMYRDLGDDLVLLPAPPGFPPHERYKKMLEWMEASDCVPVNCTMYQDSGYKADFFGQNFDQSFFRYAGLPLAEKWAGFKYARDESIEIEPPREPYVFLHEIPERKMPVNRSFLPHGMKIIWPDWGRHPNIFSWRKVVEQATEVHVVNSSFLNFIDLACEPKGRLAWHYYSRIWQGKSDPTMRLKWEILE